MSKVVPVFNYTSECCSAPAVKEPCVKAVVTEVKKGHKAKQQEFTSLGHWHCGSCGRGCKVTRTKNLTED